MGSVLLSILGFLAILGPLVIVHEFGHYLFARLFGVKAEIFSIGFGPKLWSRQCGETELRVSAVPLGGYVKLLGAEDSDKQVASELQKRTLQSQPPWKRFFIFFGGPLFNFFFAILVFMVILLIGEPQMASVVGRVVDGSPAAVAGFRSGDRITSMDGKATARFEDVVLKLNESPGKNIVFEVARAGAAQPVRVEAKPTGKQGFSIYGESKQVGEIEGLLPNARANQAGVSNPQSPAGRAGIRTGDLITAWQGKTVADWETIEKLYAESPVGPVAFTVKPADPAKPQFTATLNKPRVSQGLAADLGLHSSELFVEKTVTNSPAESAGVRMADRLVAIGETPVRSFFDLRDAVQKAGEKDGKVRVSWEREGKTLFSVVTPTSSSTKDAALKKSTQFTIGVVPMLLFAEPTTIVERTFNPFLLVGRATERMAVLTWRNVVSLQMMFTGDVSIATLGGPLLIGKIAGESIARGLIAFLTTMAILSVGLGILNVLPVPVLDGGHLVLLILEAIRGKPLTMRQMEIVQQVGLSLILVLMVIVIRNDISRLPFFD